MRSNLLYRRPFLRICLQNHSQQRPQLPTRMFRQIIPPLLYRLVQFLRVGTVKRQVPKTHRVQDDTCTPNISLETVVRMAHQHFRGCVTRTSTGCMQQLVFGVNVAQTEINQFEVELVVEQNILWFQISVNHPERMNVLNCVEKLLEELAGLKLSEL